MFVTMDFILKDYDNKEDEAVEAVVQVTSISSNTVYHSYEWISAFVLLQVT